MSPVYAITRMHYLFKDTSTQADVIFSDRLRLDAAVFGTISSNNTFTTVKPGRYGVWFRAFGSGTTKRANVKLADGSTFNTGNTSGVSGYMTVDRDAKQATIQTASTTDSSDIPSFYLDTGDQLIFSSTYDRSLGGIEAIIFYRS